MKVLHGLFLLMTWSLFLIGCGSGAADNSNTTIPPTAEKEVANTTAVKTETAATKEDMPNGIQVESTQKIAETPVNDTEVDYQKLAASVCKCSSKFKGHDDGHQGDVHVSAGDTEYQKEVDCSIAAKNAMTKGEISRQKLVAAIKGECHDIPGKLVMRVMMTIGE